MTHDYRAPRLLVPSDEVERFTCRSTEQTNWLGQHALQSTSTGSTKVFVVTPLVGDRAVAYYAWCMAQLDIEAAPSRLRQGAGRYPPSHWRCSPDSVLTPGTKAEGWEPA